MIKPILTVRNLTTTITIGGVNYTPISAVSFDLYQGKTLAIVGESGCGKSITAQSILRILPTPPSVGSDGEVLYRGENLLTLPESKMRRIRGKNIAMIFQNPQSAFNPVYTIGYQLMEVAKFHLSLSESESYETVLEALKDVSLPDPHLRFKEYPHQMSGGMLQRAMIAQAILCKPDILIADEPTTALDVTIQAQILQLLKSIQEKWGMAILLITHDMGVVAEMADEVIVMYATEKVEEGNVYEIFDQAAHPYTEALFNSRITHSLKEGRLQTIKGTVPPLTDIPQGCHFHPRCPYVMPICKEQEVPNFLVDKGPHSAKCFLFDPNLESKLSIEDEDGADYS